MSRGNKFGSRRFYGTDETVCCLFPFRLCIHLFWITLSVCNLPCQKIRLFCLFSGFLNVKHKYINKLANGNSEEVYQQALGPDHIVCCWHTKCSRDEAENWRPDQRASVFGFCCCCYVLVLVLLRGQSSIQVSSQVKVRDGLREADYKYYWPPRTLDYLETTDVYERSNFQSCTTSITKWATTCNV